MVTSNYSCGSFLLVSRPSLLFLPTPLCLPFHLGVEDEFQLGRLHEANLVCLFDNSSATHGALLYTLLDALLWIGLLVLTIRANTILTRCLICTRPSHYSCVRFISERQRPRASFRPYTDSLKCTYKEHRESFVPCPVIPCHKWLQ